MPHELVPDLGCAMVSCNRILKSHLDTIFFLKYIKKHTILKQIDCTTLYCIQNKWKDNRFINRNKKEVVSNNIGQLLNFFLRSWPRKTTWHVIFIVQFTLKPKGYSFILTYVKLLVMPTILHQRWTFSDVYFWRYGQMKLGY